MGMTAAATLSVATAVDVPWLKTPGEVLQWIAVAAWLTVTAAALRTYTGHDTGPGPGPSPEPNAGAKTAPGTTPDSDITSTTQR